MVVSYNLTLSRSFINQPYYLMLNLILSRCFYVKQGRFNETAWITQILKCIIT